MHRKEALKMFDRILGRKKVPRQQQLLNLLVGMGGVGHGTVKHMIAPEALRMIQGAKSKLPKIRGL